MSMEVQQKIHAQLSVNGVRHEVEIEPRELLSDVLRHHLGLTGTHVGCEHGVCGCCTVLVDGEPARSCLMLAAQAQGCRVETVESLSSDPDQLHPLQEGFRRAHGLQCGFCTPGFLMAAAPFYEQAGEMSDDDLREALSGQLCRCTGYVGIIEAVREGARIAAEREAAG
jgi:carbon-monoxide dehydrogenase small subunit